MKVWLIEYSNYTPDVCADEKSVRAHLKKLGLSDEEIEKALLDGVHIEDDENYDIGETWIKIWPNHDVIQYNVEESHCPRGRMLKEEDERVSLDLTISDKWNEDGKNYMELDVKKNGKNTQVKVCVVFTDKGEHLDTVFYTENDNEDLTENEVAEELDISVGDIKKLVETAKIEAMKEFE